MWTLCYNADMSENVSVRLEDGLAERLKGYTEAEAVGAHLGVQAEGERVVTHTFECVDVAYRGWHWAVTLGRVPGEDAVTVDEVVLLPGDQALLAPAWVPWHERLRPGDLSVGDVLPSTEDDVRLAPAYLVDDERAEDFRATVVRLADLRHEIRLQLTGPWAPYSFATEETEEEANSGL